MNNPIQNKVILITGASSGIGATAALRLARDGACLALAARRLERLEQVAAQVQALGGQALVIQADVCEPDDIQRMVQAALQRWGRIDVLINNAGVASGPPLLEITPDEIRRRLHTNLIAVIQCAQAVLPAMLRQKAGHIINVSSIAGLISTPGSGVYAAGKFGVIGFSDALRRDLLGSGVQVSAFCPGFTPSEINPELKAHAEGRPDAPYVPGLMPVGYVADQLARLIRRPRRRVIIPKSWQALVWLSILCPWLVDWLAPALKSREKQMQVET
jgi:short-subunit dehydrogenase